MLNITGTLRLDECSPWLDFESKIQKGHSLTVSHRIGSRRHCFVIKTEQLLGFEESFFDKDIELNAEDVEINSYSFNGKTGLSIKAKKIKISGGK